MWFRLTICKIYKTIVRINDLQFLQKYDPEFQMTKRYDPDIDLQIANDDHWYNNMMIIITRPVFCIVLSFAQLYNVWFNVDA